MLYKAELIMLGAACVLCFGTAIVMALFSNQLTQAYPEPPMWCWYSVMGIVILGGMGFVLGVIGSSCKN